MIIAGVPPEPVAAPPALQRALQQQGMGRATLQAVWQNSAGGVTFSVASGGQSSPVDFFAKWNPLSSGESLADEAERLRWIQGRHPAPHVVALMREPREEVLITQALPGESAVSLTWKSRPSIALRALGEGLKKLHDLPVEDCPFSWDVAERIRANGVKAERVGMEPPIDQLVICQGDPCAPNTLLTHDGNFLAHVDLARLGVADRWADLAVMSMSLEWSFKDFNESEFWEAYGIEPDMHRIRFYRNLWNSE